MDELLAVWLRWSRSKQTHARHRMQKFQIYPGRNAEARGRGPLPRALWNTPLTDLFEANRSSRFAKRWVRQGAE